MAYGIKYRLEFSDNESNKKKLEIEKDGYVGAVLPMVGTSTPIVITYQQDDDVYEPIIGSSANINLLVTDTVSYNDLFTPNEREFKVKLYYWDGARYVEYWQGFVIPDSYTEQITTTPYPLSFLATDGLGGLDGYDHILSVDTYYDLNTIIQFCLYQTGLGLSYSSQENLKVSTETTYTALTDTDVYSGNYYDSSFKPMDCKTILKSILKQFNLRIYQRRGSSYLGVAYPCSWVVSNNAAMLSSGVQIDVPADAIPIGNDMIKRTKGALKSIETTSESIKVINELSNGVFESGDLTGWSQSLSATITQDSVNRGLYAARFTQTVTEGTYTLGFSQSNLMPYIAAGTSFNLSFAFNFENDAFPLNLKEYGVYWQLEAYVNTGLKYYYLSDGSKWVINDVKNTFEYKGRGNYKTYNRTITAENTIYQYNATNDDYNDINNETGFGIGTDVSTGNPIYLTLRFYVPFIKSTPTGTHTYTYFDGASILVRDWRSFFGVSGQPFEYVVKNEFNKTSSVGNFSRLEKYDNLLQNSIDDIRIAGKLINNNASYDQPVAFYQRSGTDTAKRINELVNLQRLNDSRNGLVIYEGTIKKIDNSTPISIGDYLHINFSNLSETLNCLIDTLEYDVKQNAYRFTGHLVNQSTDISYTNILNYIER